MLQDLHLCRGKRQTFGGKSQEERKDVVQAGQTINGRMAEEDGQKKREGQMSPRRLGKCMGSLRSQQEQVKAIDR